MERTVINLSALEKKYIFSSRISFVSEGDQIDSAAYDAAIESSVGVERVDGAAVEYAVPFTDCEFISGFMNLERLVLDGGKIKSLQGLEKLEKLKLLSISINKRGAFNFGFLKDRDYESLDVNDLKKEEINDITKAGSINSLILRSCRLSDFAILNGCKITNLDFSRCLPDTISGLDEINIERLRFDGCSKLTAIVSDSLIKVNYLEIQTCNKFNLGFLKNVIACKSLRVSLCKVPVDLEDMCEIQELEKLTLVNCKVNINVDKINLVNSSVKSIFISPISKADLSSLKNKYSQIIWKTL